MTELKEKYNECLSLLGKTQEELSMLRRKNPSKRIMSKSTSVCSNMNLIMSANDTSSIMDIESDSCEDCNAASNNTKNNHNQNAIGLRTSSSLFSPWMSTSNNNSSLAAEVFSSLAKDYRTKNSTM